MHHSTDRILTTHIGSLPRPPELVDLYERLGAGEDVDPDRLETLVADATRNAVERQLDVGLDVINNGEQPRAGFNFYVVNRLSGFEGEAEVPFWADLTDFPSYAQQAFDTVDLDLGVRPAATEPIRYENRAAAERELEGFRTILDALDGDVEGTFLTAASPGIVATSMPDEYYDSHEEYVFAIAEAMRTEYELVADAGFTLQLDAPDLLAERHLRLQDRSLAEFKETVALHVDALNEATADVPSEDVRMHTCWGNYEGPHHRDVPLEEILPLLYEADVGAICIEQANPRHQSEYRAFEDHPVPDDLVLVPGVIDTKTNVIEPPEVVADRIERFVDVVGDPTRVLAAPDCGFGTLAGLRTVDSEIAWAKLESMVEGAALASERVF